MKQTALEWLIAEYINPKNQTSMASLFLEALQMEKEQIIQAHGKQLKKTQTAGNYEYWKTGEQYYNETYGDK
jgi:trehalose-6-phosphate synthase